MIPRWLRVCRSNGLLRIISCILMVIRRLLKGISRSLGARGHILKGVSRPLRRISALGSDLIRPNTTSKVSHETLVAIKCPMVGSTLAFNFGGVIGRYRSGICRGGVVGCCRLVPDDGFFGWHHGGFQCVYPFSPGARAFHTANRVALSRAGDGSSSHFGFAIRGAQPKLCPYRGAAARTAGTL